MNNTNFIILVVVGTTSLFAGMGYGTYYLLKKSPAFTNTLIRANEIRLQDIELNNIVTPPAPIYRSPTIIDYVPINNTNSSIVQNEMIGEFIATPKPIRWDIYDPNLIISALEYEINSICWFALIFLILILILTRIAYSKQQLLAKITANKLFIRIASIMAIIIIGIYVIEILIETHILFKFVLPLSISKITFADEFNSDIQFIHYNSESRTFALFDHKEISNFIKNLDNFDYYVTIEFVPDITNYSEDDDPKLIISKPFLINKYSSPTTVNMFIDEKLYYMVYYFSLDLEIIRNENPVFLLNYSKILI